MIDASLMQLKHFKETLNLLYNERLAFMGFSLSHNPVIKMPT
jgi:hypothetical protein